MKKVRLDFRNRIVSIVSDHKTVIAYMDEGLEKTDFQPFFPDEETFNCAENVTFDFENNLFCLKKRIRQWEQENDGASVKRIPMPAMQSHCQDMMNILGWSET